MYLFMYVCILYRGVAVQIQFEIMFDKQIKIYFKWNWTSILIL